MASKTVGDACSKKYILRKMSIQLELPLVKANAHILFPIQNDEFAFHSHLVKSRPIWILYLYTYVTMIFWVLHYTS